MPHLLTDDIERLLANANALETADESEAKASLISIIDELQPYDVAQILADIPAELQPVLLRFVPPEVAAEAFEQLDAEVQYRLLDDVSPSFAQNILAQMQFHHLVELLHALHPLRQKVLLEMVPAEQRAQIEEVQTLPADAAGRHTTVRYVEARQEWTVAQAIAHFRKVGHDVEISNYLYVVDRQGRPVGVASLREVLLSPDNTPLADIMYTKIVSVQEDTNQELAAQLVTQYDFVALPVVNSAGTLVGVISVDDLMDVMEEEATEDIQRLGGSTPIEDNYMETSFRTLFRSRVGWLLVLFIAESFTGTIMRNFEDVLQQVVALAFFIPLLIDTGGNSGSQASTMVTRAIALGQVTIKDFVHVVWRESRVGLALGAVMGIAAFIRASMLGETALLGLTVAITICLIVIVGSTIGAALPLIGHRIGVDPAVFSAPLITTVADGVGLIIYFQVAVWLLGLA